MTGIAAHVIGSSGVRGENLNSNIEVTHNILSCAAVNFADGKDMCELYTYTVNHTMKKTPEPTHDLNYKHSDILKSITSDEASKNALQRGVTLADKCKSILMCAAAALNKHGPKRWLQDTGSGNDLISKKDVHPKARKIPLDEPVHLQTANDIISVKNKVRVKVKATNELIEPLLLKSTPAVMSVGYRCIEKGYGFNWPL